VGKLVFINIKNADLQKNAIEILVLSFDYKLLGKSYRLSERLKQ